MYGSRARIGYTSGPTLAEVFPYEFYKTVPEGVTLVISTLSLGQMTKEDLEHNLQLSIKAAREMGRAKVDIVVLGGIPILLSRGLDGQEDLVQEAEREVGVPVTTSLNAQIHALQKLGSRKVALLQPQRGGDETFHEKYLSHYGFELVGVKTAETPIEEGKIPTDYVLSLARELVKEYPQADTVYLPGPHTPVAQSLDPIEQELGVNVVGALQSIVWEALRRCNVNDPIHGFGRLLREF